MHSRFMFLTIVLMLACVTQVASDIYLPSLVSISKELTDASFNLVQLSVAIFLFGVSFSQLIYGPLSEGIGRKKPLLLGLMIMSCGSLLCASATSISHLMLGRLIQGLGAGALAALWRSALRDVMSGEDLAKHSSFISLFMIFIVSVAPVLGGYFETIGWRSSFIFMLIYALISLLITYFAYQESSQHHHLDKLNARYIFNTYKTLLTSGLFMGITACTFLIYGGLFAWIVIAPSLLMYRAGLSAVEFGWCIALTGGIGYALGALVNTNLVKRLGIVSMMQIGFGLMIAAGIALFLGYYILGINLWAIMIPIFIFYFGSTLIWPNAFATAFTPFGEIAGYAGSLYGFMQLVGGAIMGSIAAHLPETDQRLLALLMVMTASFSLFIYQRIVDQFDLHS